MKILITNTVVLNGGDAAILAGIRSILRRALGDVHFTACDSNPSVARRLDPEQDYVPLLLPSTNPWLARRLVGRPLRSLRGLRLRSAARLLRRGLSGMASLLVARSDLAGLVLRLEADLVLSTGGTYLVETYSLAARLFELEIARLLGRPRALFTQSLGPFLKPAHQLEIRRELGSAAFVLLRDERSRQHLLDIGLDASTLHVSADSAFALARTEGIEATIRSGFPAAWKKVAISVRNWAHFQEQDAAEGMAAFRAAIAGCVQHLVEEKDAEVVFLSTCQGIPEYWTDDAAVAREIVAALPQGLRDRVRVDETYRDPDALIAEFGRHDLVIATRMHAAILALCAGTAVLPIAYEFKTTELFASLGLEDLVQGIEGLSTANLNTALARLSAMEGEAVEALFGAVLAARDEAMHSGEHVRALLDSKREHQHAPKT